MAATTRPWVTGHAGQADVASNRHRKRCLRRIARKEFHEDRFASTGGFVRMTRLITDGRHDTTVGKPATPAKPTWPPIGIASDASGELRERNFMKIVSLAPEVL